MLATRTQTDCCGIQLPAFQRSGNAASAQYLMLTIRACRLLVFLVGCCQPHLSLAQDYSSQCVPFARALSSIALSGDAWRWWSEASPGYERGSHPQAGSILSFRPSTRIPLGHLAVVTRVISSREIEVDHANWVAPGAISRGVQVLDISPDNNWTAVRVELREKDHFGEIYATNGFIYGRPIQIGPQIVDVAQALKALFATADNPPSDEGSAPIVLEAGRIEQSVSIAGGLGAPTLPVVIYGSGKSQAR